MSGKGEIGDILGKWVELRLEKKGRKGYTHKPAVSLLTVSEAPLLWWRTIWLLSTHYSATFKSSVFQFSTIFNFPPNNSSSFRHSKNNPFTVPRTPTSHFSNERNLDQIFKEKCWNVRKVRHQPVMPPKSLNEIQRCQHSNESYWTVFSYAVDVRLCRLFTAAEAAQKKFSSSVIWRAYSNHFARAKPLSADCHKLSRHFKIEKRLGTSIKQSLILI